MGKRNLRRTSEQWATLLEQQAQSGLAVRDFCREQQLGISTFSKWKRKLRLDGVPERQTDRSSKPDFHSVDILPSVANSPAPTTRISLTLDEGITLTIDREVSPS